MRRIGLVVVLVMLGVRGLLAGPYDPLLVADGKSPVETVDLVLTDAARKREIPLRAYLPADKAPAAVVLFSHGLGGSCRNNPYLGEHWARRGYVVVFMQHVGSDDSVWKDTPRGQRMEAMRQAASTQNFLLRVADVPAVIDQLALWNQDKSNPLFGRVDLSRIGMSGHSFGALTTQAVSGQTPAVGKGFTDKRIKAAVMMSPSPPRRGDARKAFADVSIPWLLMTGTKDDSVIAGDATAEARRSVFPALPPGSKYELVLFNAEHSAFSDRALPGDREARNPNHHRAILAVSTAFWDAFLRDDPAAKAWLDGGEVKTALEEQDRWQTK